VNYAASVKSITPRPWLLAALLLRGAAPVRPRGPGGPGAQETRSPRSSQTHPRDRRRARKGPRRGPVAEAGRSGRARPDPLQQEGPSTHDRACPGTQKKIAPMSRIARSSPRPRASLTATMTYARRFCRTRSARRSASVCSCARAWWDGCRCSRSSAPLTGRRSQRDRGRWYALRYAEEPARSRRSQRDRGRWYALRYAEEPARSRRSQRDRGLS